MSEFPLTAKPLPHVKDRKVLLKPSITSSPLDYDFLIGSHVVRHRKLKERLNQCTEWIDIEGTKNTEKILEGVGNIEKHYLNELDGQKVEAVALRLFDMSTKLWSLYWADSVSGTLDPPLQGSFENNLGLFFGKDYFKGKEVLVQFQYDRSNPQEPIWGQAFSNDLGATWEWNWFMFYKKC